MLFLDDSKLPADNKNSEMLKPRFAQQRLICAVSCVVLLFSTHAVALDVGFATADITPQITKGKPIWLAGLAQNRPATGVHDKLYARAIVLRDHSHNKFALVSADSIGIPYPIVQQVRKKLADFKYVLIASTHSHSAPDVVGIWGPAPDQSGIVPAYVDLVAKGIVDAVRQADAHSAPGQAFYGTAEDESLLGDFRLPEVYDGVLRTIRFDCVGKQKPCGILVQWNAHGVEPDDPIVTRDFMGSMVDALEKRHGCPVVYFQGAIGGLMGTPKKLVEDAKAGKLPSDTFGFINAVGEATADLADQAISSAQPIQLEPLEVFTRPIRLPLDNEGFVQALAIGVLNRPVYKWNGDRNHPGVETTANENTRLALETEVAYLRLGELHVAAIPGELYPECVYGKYQDPPDPGADYFHAPLEPAVASILPSKKILVLGLANDEVGYIVPKRQWDVKPPYAYQRDGAQYGERNSVGPETAGEVLGALSDRVADSLPDAK